MNAFWFASLGHSLPQTQAVYPKSCSVTFSASKRDKEDVAVPYTPSSPAQPTLWLSSLAKSSMWRDTFTTQRLPMEYSCRARAFCQATSPAPLICRCVQESFTSAQGTSKSCDLAGKKENVTVSSIGMAVP